MRYELERIPKTREPNSVWLNNLCWDAQFTKIGDYLFMKCKTIEKFEIDLKRCVCGLSHDKFLKWARICISRLHQGKYFHVFFLHCIDFQLIMCALRASRILLSTIPNIYVEQANKMKPLHKSACSGFFFHSSEHKNCTYCFGEKGRQLD